MKAYWLAVLERAIKTFAASLVATLGAGAVNVLTVPWTSALAIAAGATVLSVLTSIAAAGIGPTGPALFGDETVRR